MTKDIKELVQAQKAWFMSGSTRSLSARIKALNDLESSIKVHENDLLEALFKDLHKDRTESFMTELGIIYGEIRHHKKHLASWMRERRVRTPITLFPSTSRLMPEPYGCVLIVSPWNYPVQLCFEPLIGAISGGNCAVIKPSAYAPAVSSVVAEVIRDAFPEQFIAVVEGGREENRILFEQPFDYIFFTGSVAVGKEVMAAAARNLTPVTLELGGKSPVIVEKSADVRKAARKVAFGKVLNAGQTCVAPDYVLIDETIRDSFIEEYRKALKRFSPDGSFRQMASIVNEKHYERLRGLMEGHKPVIGGHYKASERRIEPSVYTDVTLGDGLMQQEIFGPLLPVLTYKTLDEAIAFIVKQPHPLALYLFTRDREVQRKVMDSCQFGGGCVNDVILHLSSANLPFGGVGASGMGQYHGKKSFETFTHMRSVLVSPVSAEIPIPYMPYSRLKEKLLRRVM